MKFCTDGLTDCYVIWRTVTSTDFLLDNCYSQSQKELVEGIHEFLSKVSFEQPAHKEVSQCEEHSGDDWSNHQAVPVGMDEPVAAGVLTIASCST